MGGEHTRHDQRSRRTVIRFIRPKCVVNREAYGTGKQALCSESCRRITGAQIHFLCVTIPYAFSVPLHRPVLTERENWARLSAQRLDSRVFPAKIEKGKMRGEQGRHRFGCQRGSEILSPDDLCPATGSRVTTPPNHHRVDRNFNPIIPAKIRAMQSNRAALADSPNNRMPRKTVPTAPIPVQTV